MHRETRDVITESPLVRMAATLDRDPVSDGLVPPLWHWLYFLPQAPTANIDSDGHEKRGEFLPVVELPRRMWAGSNLEFFAPLRVGQSARKVSAVASVTPKTGRSGDLVFVEVHHEVFAGDTLAVREAQTVVYREAPKPGTGAPSPRPAPAEPQWTRTITPSVVMLFRYSALTFNGHRIHYDRPYCIEEEGYPGLVVHGPLIATLLMESFLANNPGAAVKNYSFRAVSPLFDIHPFTVNGRLTEDGARLWALNHKGHLAMEATL